MAAGLSQVRNGVGYTTTRTSSLIEQPLAVVVMRYTTVVSLIISLLKTSAILPVPLLVLPALIPGIAALDHTKEAPITAVAGTYTNAVLSHIAGGVREDVNQGVGCTVIAKLRVGPTQPLADGVTIIFAVTVLLPVLVAVNEAMLPPPRELRPTEGSELVQVNEVPVTGPVNMTVAVLVLLQTT